METALAHLKEMPSESADVRHLMFLLRLRVSAEIEDRHGNAIAFAAHDVDCDLCSCQAGQRGDQQRKGQDEFEACKSSPMTSAAAVR